VVDPVMVAKSGSRLLNKDAAQTLRRRLLPLAEVLTPNLPEAEVLLGHPVSTREERRRAAVELVRLGCRSVVVKGGHAEDALDLYFDGARLVELPGRWVDTPNTHGSGCCFSAAIAAGLARGLETEAAVRSAKDFIQSAIENALELGGGHGPVNPLFASRAALRADRGAPPPH
ncbi:MAG: hydroxymethylpyrimidine/phosphomethylpyrimidine kinase family protein, partial [Candidatus Dormibacterales bacterium]